MSDSTKPVTAGDLLGSAGVPIFLTYRGKQYPVSPPTLRVLDRIEKLVVRRAIDSIEALQDVLTPAEYAAQSQELNSLIRAKEHGTGGKLWATEFTAEGGLRGVMLLLWACLEEARDPKVEGIDFEDMPQVFAESPDASAIVAQVMPDFTRAVGQRRKIPTAKLEESMKKALAG